MEVITANERDFRRLAEFRSFQYSVIKVRHVDQYFLNTPITLP